MNFYSSLIYIAFFKGRFFDYPGDDIARKSEFYRLKGKHFRFPSLTVFCLLCIWLISILLRLKGTYAIQLAV